MLLWLIVFEGFLLFFSTVTFDQGGFLGLISSGFVLVGILVALLRGCGDAERSFTIMLMLMAAAVGCALGQLGYTFYMLVADKGHFTRRRRDGTVEELDRDTTRAMLFVLTLAYICGLSIRGVVAAQVVRVRKISRSPRVMPGGNGSDRDSTSVRSAGGGAASVPPQQGGIVVGVPVALAHVLPGPPSAPVSATEASAPAAADGETDGELTLAVEEGTLVVAGAPVQVAELPAQGGEASQGEPVRGAPVVLESGAL